MHMDLHTHTHTHTPPTYTHTYHIQSYMYTPSYHTPHTPFPPILPSPPHTHPPTHTYRNVFLYYTTGVTLGVVASLLVLLYVFSKFVPKVSARLLTVATPVLKAAVKLTEVKSHDNKCM